MEHERLLPAVTRRGFLKTIGAGTIVIVADSRNLFDNSVFASLQDVGGTLTTRLIRPDDQLRLRFEFINLEHDVANNQLIAGPTGTPLMKLTLARQHLSERPIPVGGTPPGASSAPIDHRVAGASRLVFAVTPPLALTVPALLDLAAHALVTSVGTGNPTATETMIEVPADLRLSPASDVELTADIAPFTSGRVSQLHRIILSAPGPIRLSPVDNGAAVDGFPLRVPDAGDRSQFVSLASAEGPAIAQRMWLTPHGAWADLSGDWSSISWFQNIRGGRDEFAQVVNRGVVMPFGHPAVWTQTATRLWLADADGEIVSTMVTEEHFAVVESATLDFPSANAPSGGRSMPLRSVTIEQKDSLAVDKGNIAWATGSIPLADAWFVNYNAPGALWDGGPVRLSYSATDTLGNEPITFSLPAIFVRTESAASVAAGLGAFYNSDAGAGFRSASMRADVAWAEEEDAGSGATTFLTKSIDFGVQVIPSPGPGELPIAPVIRGGNVMKPELNSARPTPEQLDIEVVYNSDFLLTGNNPTFNPTRAFLDLVTPTNFPLGTEARAVMTPEMRAEQFNQSLGIGAALDAAGGGGGSNDTWRPAEAFGADATILRGVKLADLVLPILFDLATPGIDIPGFELETLPDRIIQSYRWCPDSIRSVPAAGFIATSATSLCISVTAVIGLADGVEASSTVTFEVDDFTLVVPPLLSLIELDINSMKALQSSSGATDLTFDIGDWRLGGALSWLEPLISKLSPAGSDFGVDVIGTSIVAELELSLPNITLGVLVIKNFTITLTGSFPFSGTDDPTIGIGVGTRTKPVTLQIQQFRGGFWCEMVFSTQGLELLHIHADATAMLVEIDIVIANAYCYVTVGADFTLKNGNVTFVGYLSLSAGFSVLGLVGASLEVVGRVKYKEADEKITISGTIIWSVTAIATFSGRVPLGELSFKTGNGGAAGFAPLAARTLPAQASADPAPGGSFGTVHTLATWRDYVAKFAPEAA
jgi:hypothetical protein